MLYIMGHQRGARRHQIARGPVLKITLAWMINAFTLTNINTKIIKGKLSKILVSEVCIKLVALHIGRYPRRSSWFQKDW